MKHTTNVSLATILIPVYQPDIQLVKLMQEVLKVRPQQPIIVVDDGSTSKGHEKIFAEIQKLGAVVLTHDANRGKGEALKTGMRYFLQHKLTSSPGVVTADADGQHLAADVLKICKKLEQEPDVLQLGIRQFSKKTTPLRSRIGNFLSALVFWRATRVVIDDTQTGLRGIPLRLLKRLVLVKWSGFEFELEMLLLAQEMQLKLNQIKITTVYKNKNALSHFRPFLDSLRVFVVFVKFSLISIVSAGIDYLLFCFTYMLSREIFLSVVTARVVSATFNFSLNKHTVFKHIDGMFSAAIKYAILASVLVLASYLLTVWFTHLSTDVYISKIAAEIILFATSFIVQRFYVFR